ncbi:MAG: cysteine--tRNA ligase [Candidatus Dojkabacteria bacterium]
MFKFYNTLNRKKESFTVEHEGKVSMYNCGPTVYSRLTIGNLRTNVFSDLLRRSLEYVGFEVKQVMNITDVGHLTMTDEQKRKNVDAEVTDTDDGVDRMEKAAKRDNMTVWEVASHYTKLFVADMDELNIKRPHVMPRATDHIAEQVTMIKQLIDKGYAYVTKTAVYFDTSKFAAYSHLAGQDLNEKQQAVRNDVEQDETKRHPADFRLWQLNRPDHAMQWDSPWGKGFPGWHIECSAMSLRYLGQPIDIHTGGTDHIPVHHTNEIAQSEAATGSKFVNYWLHGAFLTVDNKRMGKSLGNAYTLADVEAEGFDPLDLRYFYLTAHYRQILNFTWEALGAASARLVKLEGAVEQWRRESGGRSGQILNVYKDKFVAAISDDLNIPKALGVVSELLDADEKAEDRLATLLDFDKVLGLGLYKINLSEEQREDIETLVSERKDLRHQKQWKKADAIRDELLTKYSVELDDTDTGTQWRWVRPKRNNKEL